MERHLRVKPSGRTEVRFRLPGQPQPTGRTFDSRDQAAAWAALGIAAGWEHAVALLARPGVAAAMTVDTWARQHVTHMTSVNEDTRRDYLRAIDDWPPYIADMPLPGVAVESVKRWVNEMRAAGLSPKTIQNRHSLLSNVLRAAVEAGHVATNVAHRVPLPKGKSQPGTHMSGADVDAIFGELDPWYHPLVQLWLATGARFGEATALHWSDVVLTGPNPHIRIRVTWKQWPGGFALGPPKTLKSIGTIAISDGLVRVLATHLAQEESRGRGRTVRCECPLVPGTHRPSGSLVFTTRRGARVGDRFRQDIWRPAVRRAVPHLHPPPTPHDCRHAMATYLLGIGVPIQAVQERLRHESINTTVAVYGHLQPDVIRAAADAADALIGRPPQQVGAELERVRSDDRYVLPAGQAEDRGDRPA